MGVGQGYPPFPGCAICFGQRLIDQYRIISRLVCNIDIPVENFQRPGAGGNDRFTHGEVFVDLEGIVTDSDLIDRLRVDTDIEAGRVPGQLGERFLPEEMDIGEVVERALCEIFVFRPYEDDVVVGAGDGDLADGLFVEAKRVDGADIADDGMRDIFQVFWHGIVLVGVEEAGVAALADIEAVGVVAAQVVREVVGVRYGDIGLGDVPGLYGCAVSFPIVDAQQVVAANVGQKMSDIASQTLQKNMDVQPTITIYPGYRFNVVVLKDMILEKIDDVERSLSYSS